MFNRIFLLFFILVGCTYTKENSPGSERVNISFQLKKIKIIPLAGQDVSLSYAIQYPHSSLIYLTNFNTDSTILIYSLDLNTLKLQTILDIIPDFHLEAYSIDQKKSNIYLFTGEELIIYNFQNQQLSRKPFGALKEGFLSNLNPVGFYPYIKDNVLFIEYFPNVKETYKSKFFYRQPFQVAIHLNNNELQFLVMTYPQEYQNKCFGYNFIPDRIVGDNNTHVISFPYNDSVYIYNEQGNLLETNYFGSKTKKQFQFIPYEELNNLQQEVFDEFNKDMPHYGFSTFYSFSKIYSRQLMWYNNKTGKKEGTIVFFDVNWNYLGELNTPGTMCLFDSPKYGILKIQNNNDHLEVYGVKI